MTEEVDTNLETGSVNADGNFEYILPDGTMMDFPVTTLTARDIYKMNKGDEISSVFDIFERTLDEGQFEVVLDLTTAEFGKLSDAYFKAVGDAEGK